eukprot:COSAG04_NODE_63_length_30038_cov_9.461071_14_plen_387_part_00
MDAALASITDQDLREYADEMHSRRPELLAELLASNPAHSAFRDKLSELKATDCSVCMDNVALENLDMKAPNSAPGCEDLCSHKMCPECWGSFAESLPNNCTTASCPTCRGPVLKAVHRTEFGNSLKFSQPFLTNFVSHGPGSNVDPVPDDPSSPEYVARAVNRAVLTFQSGHNRPVSTVAELKASNPEYADRIMDALRAFVLSEDGYDTDATEAFQGSSDEEEAPPSPVLLSNDLLLVEHPVTGSFHMTVKKYDNGYVVLNIVRDRVNTRTLEGWCFVPLDGGTWSSDLLTTRCYTGFRPHSLRLVYDARPGLNPPNTPHEVIFDHTDAEAMTFTDTTEDPEARLRFTAVDTSATFTLPEGAAATIGTRERFEQITAANRAARRDQ